MSSPPRFRTTALSEAEQKLFIPGDGLFRARDLSARGISRKRLMQLTKAGYLERVGRGIYRLPDAPITENHTLAQVASRAPHGVVCLLSALQFHQLTTQNP